VEFSGWCIYLDANIITELVAVLQKETKIYENILEISKNKTNIIIEGKVAELENIVKLEQMLVLQLGKLETAREELIEKISSQVDLKPSDITITKLMDYVSGGQIDDLKNCQQNMAEVLKELNGVNDLNSRLVKNSLDYINFSINLLSGADSLGASYSNNGNMAGSKKHSFLDIKL